MHSTQVLYIIIIVFQKPTHLWKRNGNLKISLQKGFICVSVVPEYTLLNTSHIMPFSSNHSDSMAVLEYDSNSDGGRKRKDIKSFC